jgi:hypothetical protein
VDQISPFDRAVVTEDKRARDMGEPSKLKLDYSFSSYYPEKQLVGIPIQKG